MFSRLFVRSFTSSSSSLFGRRAFSTFAAATASAFTFASLRSAKVAIPIVAAATAVGTIAQSSLSSSTVECAANRLPLEGVPGTNSERTFIAIKPDGVQRQLIGKIIGRFEEKGFKLVAMKLITPSLNDASEHYADLKTKPFFPGLIKFFSSGPIIGMVWEGKNAVKTGRQMLGETDPAKSLPGSIRGDYSIEVGRNICHGSDSTEGAKAEINFWFKPDEVFDWETCQAQWVYEKPKA